MTRRLFFELLISVSLLSTGVFAAPPHADNKQMTTTTVYELRIYHAAPGKLGELLARFRDHTIQLFGKHGMKVIGFWTPLDEPDRSNMLIYILQHPSREAAAANWKSFQDDPEWKRVKEESEAHGPLVEKVDSTYMGMTDFSPRLR